jgi:preprotein translocase subunit YajC
MRLAFLKSLEKLILTFATICVAQSAMAQTAGASGGASLLESMVPLIFVFVVMYLLVFRPQAKKQKEHQTFVSALKRGDEVLTASGILGTIEGLTEQFVTLEIAPDVRIKVLRGQIAGSAQALTAAKTAGAKA